MLFGNCISGPCALFRREVIDKHHIQHNVRMRTSQDFFFWHQCLKYGKFHNLDMPLFCYRVGHNSQSNQNRTRNPKEYEDILKKIFCYAWRARGFYLSKDEIIYIYIHFYKCERVKTIPDWMRGFYLYHKIKNQAKKIKLPEKQKILDLYRGYIKNM